MMLTAMFLLFQNKNNWTIHVKHLLNNAGFPIVWENHDLRNEMIFVGFFLSYLNKVDSEHT